ELLHASGVALGLVTNGEHWMLVFAPRGETTGYASWYGALWLDEPITLRAFHSLLGVRRFFGVAADNTLLGLLSESAQDQQEVTDLYGPQVLERRFDAWARLLATFRAVHAGVHHQDLLMPAYGGSLFDPDRYPFLEGRSVGTNWTTTQAEPLAVNNRVALHLLTSLQKLRIKIPGGGPSEARRVSFRALGCEQIGH